VICFVGGSFRISPNYEYEYQRNQVFGLISEENIDALIISSATLVSHIDFK